MKQILLALIVLFSFQKIAFSQTFTSLCLRPNQVRLILHFKCKEKTGILNNWWPYIIDFNEGKALENQISDCDYAFFDDVPPPNYCASRGNFPWEDWISRVQVGDLDKPSGKSQYSDFTASVANLDRTAPVPFTLTTGFSYFTFDEYWTIWLDGNHDGVFSSPDEIVIKTILQKPADGTSTASKSGTLSIPTSALDGSTQIRVSMKRGSFSTSCETFPFGEVEDFSVNISGNLPKPDLFSTAWEIIPGNFDGTTNPGQAMTYFGGTLRNPSAVSTAGFNVKAWISTDNVIGAGDVLWQTIHFSGAAPNAALGLNIHSPVPLGIAAGQYFALVQVDSDNDVAENDETNNIFQTPLHIGRSCSLTAQASNVSCAGQSTTFTVLVNAIGGGPDGWVGLYNVPQGGATQVFSGQYGVPKTVTLGRGPYNSVYPLIFDQHQTGCNTTILVECPSTGQYCESKGNFPWEDWISRVQIGDLDKPSGKSQYSNFTASVANLDRTAPVPFTLTTGFSYFTFDEYWTIWLDGNHDGVFSSPDEIVIKTILQKPADGTSTASKSGTFSIPTSALDGSTQIRVSMKRGSFSTSCETFPFGEVEDFSVNIQSGGGGGTGADLELTLTADKPTAPIFSNVSYLLKAKNTGNQAIDLAKINIGVCLPNSGLGFSNLTGLVYAGTPPPPNLGTFDLVAQVWTLTNLMPGQVAQLTIPLFILTAAERKVVAFSQNQSPADPDSQPGTVSNCTPSQDDESVWVLNAGQILLAPDDRKWENEKFEIEKMAGFTLFPNPANDQLNLVFPPENLGKTVQVKMFNQLGVLILERAFSEIAEPLQTLDLSGILNGQYFLKIEIAEQQTVFKKLMVSRLD